MLLELLLVLVLVAILLPVMERASGVMDPTIVWLIRAVVLVVVIVYVLRAFGLVPLRLQ